MGMRLALHSVSDENIDRILSDPPLIWRLLATEDPDIYREMAPERKSIGFFHKLSGKKETPARTELPQLEFCEGENLDTDLDKAWQGIHYCLNRSADDAEPPMDFIMVGGEPVGDIDVGYGPARVIRSGDVQEIDRVLTGFDLQRLKQNYDPEAMDQLDIYPAIWVREGEEGFEYVAEYFEMLRKFVSHCARHRLGMAVYLC